MDTPRKPPDDTDMVNSVRDMAAELQTPSPIRPITVDEFNRLWNTGFFGPEERVELVEGELIARETMNPPHAAIVGRMHDMLRGALSDQVWVRGQLPVVLSDVTEPIPDLSLVCRRDDYYYDAHPIAVDTIAIVEVSDSMLAFDRGDKLRTYSKAGIIDYWVVDVNARMVEIYREPHDLGYGQRSTFAGGDMVSFAAFPDVEFSVDELLG